LIISLLVKRPEWKLTTNPSSAQIKKEWRYTSTPLTHLHDMQSGNCFIPKKNSMDARNYGGENTGGHRNTEGTNYNVNKD
jgi:hypothetical protein